MSYNALCHLMAELEVPAFLRTAIEVFFRRGDMDAVVAILNSYAEDPLTSNCRVIDVAALEEAANAPAEPWAQDAAERIRHRMGLPMDANQLFTLSRCVEEECDRRDWDRARAFEAKFPMASEGWNDQPPPDCDFDGKEEEGDGNAPT